MSSKIAKNALSLPPNVNGRCRGQLALHLCELNWQSAIAINFGGIQTKIIWWGESYQSGAVLRLVNTQHGIRSGDNVFRYNILTKLKLFKEYLQSCEPIELKFSSATTNLQIGTAFIAIPVGLIDFIRAQAINSTRQVTIIKDKFNIFNSRNKIIGDITVKFQAFIYDHTIDQTPRLPAMETTDDLSAKCHWKSKLVDENDKNRTNLVMNEMCHSKVDKNKKNLNKLQQKSDFGQMVGLTRSACINAVCIPEMPLRTMKICGKDSKSSPFVSYLTGRSLTPHEEIEALREMESVSPTESFIDALSADLKCLQSPKKMKNNFNGTNKIDSMRIRVYDLILTKAGVREISCKNGIQRTSFAMGTFIVEVKLDASTPKSFSSRRFHRCSYNSGRIFSSYVNDSASRIEFNSESILEIDNPGAESAESSAVIALVLWYRNAELSHSQIVGTTSIQMNNVVRATDFTHKQQCSVRTSTGDILLGVLSVKIELGCRGLHFGSEFLEAISLEADDGGEIVNAFGSARQRYPFKSATEREHHICPHMCENYTKLQEHEKKMDDLILSACVYDTHEEQSDEKVTTPSSSSGESNGSNTNQTSNQNGSENKLSANSEGSQEQGQTQLENELDDEFSKHLNGLLHIGLFNFDRGRQQMTEVFLVCRPFWSEYVLITEKFPNNVLNFLELFSILCDENFFEVTKHSFMVIELWQKTNDQPDIVLGSAKLPLHQFYIAFYDVNVRRHVYKQKLPVISIDGWATIISSADTLPIGTLQVILAIGSAEQISYLQKSRSLSPCRNFLRLPSDIYSSMLTSVPDQTHFSGKNSNAETQTSFDGSERVATNSEPVPLIQPNNIAPDREANIAAMFSNFIDNLASRLPERPMTSTANPMQQNNASIDTASLDLQTNASKVDLTHVSKTTAPYLRATSDLLDELQRALTISPPPNQENCTKKLPVKIAETQSSQTETNDLSSNSQYKVLIEIENALHLSTIVIRVNKKCGKRGRDPATQSTTSPPLRGGNVNKIEPSTYVTFEASGPQTSIVNSGEGPVYTTNVVESSCSPQWNKRFEVFLPVDLLLDDKKRFVLRVWRKTSNDIPQARILPNLSEDVVIGFVAIDLTVLMAGMPSIAGWFNIVDFAGRINGQIKVNIKPKEDIKKFRQPPEPIFLRNNFSVGHHQHAPAISSTTSTQHLLNAVSDEISSDHTVLSRTLKRKFTELEEITQRLRARLFDVAGSANIDPDDQFECDLNTEPNEEDDFMETIAAAEAETEDDFDWLQHCQRQTSNNLFDNQSSNTSLAVESRAFEELLSQYEAKSSAAKTHLNENVSQMQQCAKTTPSTSDSEIILGPAVTQNTLARNNLLIDASADAIDGVVLDERAIHTFDFSFNEPDQVQTIAEALKISAINEQSPATKDGHG